MGLWCGPSLPLECVTHGNGKVVIGMAEVDHQVNWLWGLPECAMAAICVELGGTQERPSCEPWWAATADSGTGHTDARCC